MALASWVATEPTDDYWRLSTRKAQRTSGARDARPTDRCGEQCQRVVRPVGVLRALFDGPVARGPGTLGSAGTAVMTRRFLRAICRALIGSNLPAQSATAAYACPGMSPAVEENLQMLWRETSEDDTSDVVGTPAVHPGASCEDTGGRMDPSFANLCAKHGHQGQQSDHAATLSVLAAVWSALYFTRLVPESPVAPRSSVTTTGAPAAVLLPQAIQHRVKKRVQTSRHTDGGLRWDQRLHAAACPSRHAGAALTIALATLLPGCLEPPLVGGHHRPGAGAVNAS